MYKKKLITLTVYVFSLIIILTPYAAFGQGGWGSRGLDTIDNSVTGLPEGTISNIVKNIMLWILGLVGVIGVIGFAIAGIFYLTAAGDDSRMEFGKNAMKWSIIGIIVALMGFVIIQAVDTMLGTGVNTTF